MKKKSEARRKELHDKYFHYTITKEEVKELLSYYPNEVELLKNVPSKIGEFLYTSHPDYGKPDKDGIIRII
jgi:hypothetical protein